MFYLNYNHSISGFSIKQSEFAQNYPFEVFTDPAHYQDPTENLLGFCCRLLDETGQCSFELKSELLTRTVRVSPHFTLLLIQLPDIVNALVNPLVREFVIEFCEQGLVETFTIRIQSEHIYTVFREDRKIDFSIRAFRDLFTRLTEEFVGAVTLLEKRLVELPKFVEWRKCVQLPVRNRNAD